MNINVSFQGQSSWDIPHNKFLSKAPDGYSCEKNKKDKKQYCICKPGKRIVKFTSKHYNKEEDRVWDLGCKAIDPELTVESEKWIRKTERNELDEEQRWNGIGTNSFLVGMESEHDNKAEDRTYSFFTARSDNFRLQECSEWTKLNDFDKEVDLRLEGDGVIAAIKSVHKNKHEDRVFSVITCQLKRKVVQEVTTTFDALSFYSENIQQDFTSLRMKVTDGVTTAETRIPSSADGNLPYWVIGCMTADVDGYNYVPVNKLTEKSPLEENPRFCNNLFMDTKAQTFPANVFIEAQVRDQATNLPVQGASIVASYLDDAPLTAGGSAITNQAGVARIPIYGNARYQLMVDMPGYTNNWNIVDVDCSDSSCAPETFISVAPSMTGDRGHMAMFSLDWDPAVEDMSMKVYTVDASTSDQFCLTEPGSNPTSDCSAAPLYTLDSTSGREGDVVTVPKLGFADRVSYLIAVSDGGNQQSLESLNKARSVVTYQDKHGVKKVYQDMKFVFDYGLKGALMFGEWMSIADVFHQSVEDQRNTMIVQLDDWTNVGTERLQSMTNEELMEAGWIVGFLKVYDILPQTTMKFMSLQEQKTAAIEAIIPANAP